LHLLESKANDIHFSEGGIAYYSNNAVLRHDWAICE